MDNTTAHTDERLVRAILAGDREAFGTLVERHYQTLRAVAMAYGNAGADADDLVQDACIKSYEALGSLRQPDRFLPWCIKTLIRLGQEGRRKESRRHRLLNAQPPEQPVEMPGPQRDEMRAIVRRELNKLDEQSRAVLLMRYYAGHSVNEIANALGIGRNAAAKRLQRAREKLGDRLLGFVEEAEDRSDRRKRVSGIVAAVAAIDTTWTKGAAAGSSGFLAKLATMRIATGIIALAGLGTVATYAVWDGFEPRTARPQQASAPISVPAPASEDPPSEPEAVRASEAPSETIDANAATRPQTAVITGQIYKKGFNKPIANAEIKIASQTGGENIRMDTLFTLSDDEGRFRLPDLEPGLYRFLDYSLNGLPGGSIGQEVKVKAGDIVTFDLPLDTGNYISGIVENEQGEPLSGVYVQALTNQENISRHAESDDDGTFEVIGFKTGGRGFHLTARKDGYAMPPMTGIVVPEEGLSGVKLTMAPESTIGGHVVDEFGRAVPDVGVMVRDMNLSTYDLPGTRSSSDGTFMISRLHEGRFRLVLSDPGGMSYSTVNEVAQIDVGRAENIRDVVLVSNSVSGLTISGTVTDSSGKAQDHARILIEGPVSRSVGADTHGRFIAYGLPEGTYRVIASDFDQSAWVDNVPAGSENIHLVMPAHAALSGTVVDANTGAAIPQFEIACRNTSRLPGVNELRWHLKGTTNPAGRFELDQVTAGSASILVRAEGYAQRLHIVAGIESGAEINNIRIELDPGTVVSGMVQNAEAQPIPGAAIYLGPLPSQSSLTHAIASTTDEHGAFSVRIDPRDTDTISVNHSAYAAAEIPVTALRGHRAITLTSGGILEGRLTLDGAVLEGRSVAVSINGTYIASDKTNREGAFRIERLMPGIAEITAHLPRLQDKHAWRSVIQEASVEEGSVTHVELAALSGSAAIQGSVTTPDSLAVNAHIALEIQTESAIFSTGAVRPVDGRYTITGLPAGFGTLKLNSMGEYGDERTWAWDVQVVDGQTLELDLPLTNP